MVGSAKITDIKEYQFKICWQIKKIQKNVKNA